ncbi:MAG: DUF177 domain-containing protein [Deltaproteobacteria bacterium]|nr:DUF177 domain-containing protein [Deltaproteobacteria bacterium]
MFIDFNDITRGTRTYDFRKEKDWWPTEDLNLQVLGLDAPLKVRIEVTRTGDKYILKGSMSGGISARCDKCLEPYHLDLKSEFQLLMVSSSSDSQDHEIELLDEDMNISFIKDNAINLDDVILEQIYLSLPIQSCCSESCKGLCPVCGTNLNRRDCECESSHGHPAFLKLKNLKKEGV